MSRTTMPIIVLLVGLGLFIHGAWLGIHVIRLELEGVATNAVVLRVETRTVGSGRNRRHETLSILRVHEHECTVVGNVGSIGRSIPVHYASGRPSDCAIDGGIALRAPLASAVPGLLLLVGAFIAYQRASAAAAERSPRSHDA